MLWHVERYVEASQSWEAMPGEYWDYQEAEKEAALVKEFTRIVCKYENFLGE